VHVWLIEIGEPVRRYEPDARPWRVRRVALELVRRGHAVTMWASTFCHVQKRHYVDGPVEFDDEGIQYRLLHAPAFGRNVSFARLRNHLLLARRFREAAQCAAAPDLVVCSYPTIELSHEAVRYGRARGIPTVLDVRDLWPDLLADVLPQPLRPLARLPLAPYYAMSARALANADALISISPGYLNWALRRANRSACTHDGVFPLGSKDRRRAVAAPAAIDALRQRGVDPDRRICWFVGTFTRSYNLATVIDAAREFQRRGDRQLQFVLSGVGEQDATLRKLAAGLDNVVFTGWLEDAGIGAMGRCAWIGLQPYRQDAAMGLANKLYEYLSFGLPLVSSLPGENAELIREHLVGVSYDADDPMSLVEQLDALLTDNEDVVAMGTRARALFEQRFEVTRIYEALASHLEQVRKGAASRSNSAS
jgi:glycosyltransferase involved in cell wall biosynthesis